ncbi:MAG: bifunctional diaminohydroxyphosphoribosylaminopyrimidine deaminase/5-amino-6-(5-phosphoribosylamino)uracil reductase RibD [Gemmatimonadaceae bacterium]|nr:bifunctional diaminohydroxyphosphoribosylaminopyrimidine deaminase/5-amino-6-(5-phosphoribosylamino)uracil reductase RibD [Gemmatimonadaceae bacterium]
MDQSEFGSRSDDVTVLMLRADDSAQMRHALSLAERGWGQTAPNPMVGAVVVQGGKIVGEGFHVRYGADHAEVDALNAAGDRARGATLYVNLEPCNHHGQTPPCTESIIRAGIRRVVVALPDPNPLASGGIAMLRSAGLDVVVGIEMNRAIELNAPFLNRFAARRPWVTLKLAMTVDGAIADFDGGSNWITGEESRAEVHRMRAGSDAVAVGMRTLISDNPRLSARTAPLPRRQPARIIFGRGKAMPSHSHIMQTAHEVPTYLVTYEEDAATLQTLRRAGVEVIEAADLRESLAQIRERGIDSLLVEGGAGLAAEFIERGFVDRLVIFQAPMLLGSGSLTAFSGLNTRRLVNAMRLEVMKRQTFGPDQMTVYAFPAP